MPRLSLWKAGKHTNDYRFFDKLISEQFTVGATDIFVHKYLGPTPIDPDKATPDQPANTNQSELNIQDLLFLENRDRKYEPDVYTLRGHYQVSDHDFDLSQFGIFLQTGTLFMVFHINDMVQTIGRNIINGDVLELPHLVDFYALDTSISTAIKRFFVVSDCSRAADGYSPTWWPHLWRCKINPITDGQEYKDILNRIAAGEDTPVGQIISTIDKYLKINDAIIQQAEADVPLSGYDTKPFYSVPANAGNTNLSDVLGLSTDATDVTADNVSDNASAGSLGTTPMGKVNGYMTGDGLAPNGTQYRRGIVFPLDAQPGDYFLRADYLPNRLFRYNGQRWVKVEDSNRNNLTPGPDNKSIRSLFVNDSSTYTDRNGVEHPTLQNLNDILKPGADNV